MTCEQVIDVGTALSLMLEDDNTASETFELYGPTNYSMAEIAELVDKEIYKKRRHINLPKSLLKPAAKYLNRYLWWKTTSADEIEREYLDQDIDPKAKTFRDLGIEPAELKNYTFHYLVSGLPKVHSGEETDRLTRLRLFSKGTEVRLSMIYHQLQNEKREKRRSIFMSLMISDLLSSS